MTTLCTCRQPGANSSRRPINGMVTRNASTVVGLSVVVVALVLSPIDVAAQERVPRTASRTARPPERIHFDATASMKASVVLQDFRQIRDVKYDPKPIGAITTDIAPTLAGKVTTKPEFDVAPPRKTGSNDKSPRTPHLWRDARFSTDEAVAVSRPDGGWVVQRLYGPVASFPHLPLYFEEAGLERCGDSTFCLGQSLLSATHFYGTFAVLPYKMADRLPWRPLCLDLSCPERTLSGKVRRFGHDFRMKPAAVQAATIATVFLIFP